MPDRDSAAVLDRYPDAEVVRWVQEEPVNQGPWPFIGLVLPESCPGWSDQAGLAARDGRPRPRLVEGARGGADAVIAAALDEATKAVYFTDRASRSSPAPRR